MLVIIIQVYSNFKNGFVLLFFLFCITIVTFNKYTQHSNTTPANGQGLCSSVWEVNKNLSNL